jgi:hypothetical protein
LTSAQAGSIEEEVLRAIIQTIVGAEVVVEIFDGFAVWARRQDRASPLEIFTLNYDLLLEAALERAGALYFDGFVGTIQAGFHDYLVESPLPGDQLTVPASFVRVWKLHGSINWLRKRDGEDYRVLRLGSPVRAGDTAAIYPSEEKYVASRRVPFLVLHDRFRRALNEPETLLIVTGYSFGDDHLNEVVFDAAARRPRSSTIVCCHNSIPDKLRERATLLPNLLVASPDEAIIRGVAARWKTESDLPGAFEGGRFLLGDFAALSHHLASLTPGSPDAPA